MKKLKWYQRLWKGFTSVFNKTKAVVDEHDEMGKAIKEYIEAIISKKNPDSKLLVLLDGLDEEIDLILKSDSADYIVAKLDALFTKVNLKTEYKTLILTLITGWLAVQMLKTQDEEK